MRRRGRSLGVRFSSGEGVFDKNSLRLGMIRLQPFSARFLPLLLLPSHSSPFIVHPHPKSTTINQTRQTINKNGIKHQHQHRHQNKSQTNAYSSPISLSLSQSPLSLPCLASAVSISVPPLLKPSNTRLVIILQLLLLLFLICLHSCQQILDAGVR